MNLWIHGNRRSVSGITLKFLCKSKYFWQCYVTKTWVLFWTCPSWFFQMQCFRNWTVSIIWCKRGKVLLHAVLQITMATSMLPALTLKSSSSFCPLSVFIYFIRFSQLWLFSWRQLVSTMEVSSFSVSWNWTFIYTKF